MPRIICPNTVDVAYPLRVIYTVGVQDGVKTANGAVDAGKIDESYKSRHTEGDRLHFYCNLFDGEKECVHGLTAGNAQAQFAPSASNPYYIVQEDIPLYTDNECTMAATGDSFDPDSVYYYTVQFYGAAHTITEVRSLSHTALNVEKKNGQWNIRPGQPYEPNTAARHAEKVNQQTDTAALCAYATMDDATAFAYHGNNGRLSVRAPQGSLTVSKTVAGTGARPDDAFSFTVTLSDTAVAGAYGGMTFTDGVATFPLKHGESRTASGLPAGIHYQVREATVAGYTASSEGGERLHTAGRRRAGALCQPQGQRQRRERRRRYPHTAPDGRRGAPGAVAGAGGAGPSSVMGVWKKAVCRLTGEPAAGRR